MRIKTHVMKNKISSTVNEESFHSNVLKGGSILTPETLTVEDGVVSWKKRNNNLISSTVVEIPMSEIASMKHNNKLIGSDLTIRSRGGDSIEAMGFNTKDIKRVLELIKDNKVFEGEMIEGGKGQSLKPEDVDPFELEIGTRVELEHVSQSDEIKQSDVDDSAKLVIAQEIALDHLSERDDYYTYGFYTGLFDEDISDIIAKYPDSDRVKALNGSVKSEISEDFQTHVKHLLSDLGLEKEKTGFDFDSLNSGIIDIAGKSYLSIKNFNYMPGLYLTPEEAIAKLGSTIKGKLAFDPKEYTQEGKDILFPLKEMEIEDIFIYEDAKPMEKDLIPTFEEFINENKYSYDKLLKNFKKANPDYLISLFYLYDGPTTHEKYYRGKQWSNPELLKDILNKEDIKYRIHGNELYVKSTDADKVINLIEFE